MKTKTEIQKLLDRNKKSGKQKGNPFDLAILLLGVRSNNPAFTRKKSLS